LNGQLNVLAAVEQVVDRTIAVAAGDEDGGRAELADPLCELAPRAPAAVRNGRGEIGRGEGPVDVLDLRERDAAFAGADAARAARA
ncbi:MAG TPA: hypothetical protein VG144_13365, partial [Gaiellaceae bacterium]|nr:hypothetical protein [Gaiellaceae bacterium]